MYPIIFGQLPRTNTDLCAVIEELRTKAGYFHDGGDYEGFLHILKVVEVPDDVDWEIIYDEFSGSEFIQEKRRVWY